MAKGRGVQHVRKQPGGHKEPAEGSLRSVTPEGLYEAGYQAPQSGGVQVVYGITT